MTMDPRRPIYVVDDDVDLAASLARFLQRSGHEATPFSDPEALLATYASAPAACGSRCADAGTRSAHSTSYDAPTVRRSPPRT